MLDFGLATDAELRSELCGRLRAQRLAKGLSQADLAQRAAIGLVTVRRLESGVGGTFENFLRVVMALGLADELADLFTLKVRSIAQMERAEAVSKRQRAPRRKMTPSTAVVRL